MFVQADRTLSAGVQPVEFEAETFGGAVRAIQQPWGPPLGQARPKPEGPFNLYEMPEPWSWLISSWKALTSACSEG
jgi:hypothetical protein